MKKDHIRDYATEAFRFYARMGCPTYKQAEEAIRQEAYDKYELSEPQYIIKRADVAVAQKAPELADIAAVEETLRLLEYGGEGHIAKVVREVYFHMPGQPLERGDIEARVNRLSLHMPAGERSIYRWLKKARQLFAAVRRLRI